ncbi:MAG: SAM-dependent methyltransferase [Pseudonocardiaceae bacterium]
MERRRTPIKARSRQRLVRFSDGLELLVPGMVSASLWRPQQATSVSRRGG